MVTQSLRKPLPSPTRVAVQTHPPLTDSRVIRNSKYKNGACRDCLCIARVFSCGRVRASPTPLPGQRPRRLSSNQPLSGVGPQRARRRVRAHLPRKVAHSEGGGDGAGRRRRPRHRWTQQMPELARNPSCARAACNSAVLTADHTTASASTLTTTT
eukprot:1667348-Pleurochrysis_carterae.AAC.1